MAQEFIGGPGGGPLGDSPLGGTPGHGDGSIEVTPRPAVAGCEAYVGSVTGGSETNTDDFIGAPGSFPLGSVSLGGTPDVSEGSGSIESVASAKCAALIGSVTLGSLTITPAAAIARAL